MINQRRRLPHTRRRPNARSDSRRALPSLPLNPNDHTIQQRAHLQTGLIPLLKVPGSIDRAAHMPLRANRPVLGESGGADDGRGVDAPLHPDLVDAAVALKGAVAGVVGVVGGVVLVAEGLDHIVFGQRVGGPAVEAEVGVAVGAEGAGVVEEPWWQREKLLADVSSPLMHPGRRDLHSLATVAFSDNEISSVGIPPVNRVLAGLAADPSEVGFVVGPVLCCEALLSLDKFDLILLSRAKDWSRSHACKGSGDHCKEDLGKNHDCDFLEH